MRCCRIVNFAVPADDRMKMKESENIDQYPDIDRELKKTGTWGDGDINCGLYTWEIAKGNWK